jgi:alpha-methylacyl-CoA racemase
VFLFSTLLPGLLAGLLLAEAGADVIKIERPGSGDEMRTYSPKLGSDSANFVLQFRPGVMQRLGLGFDALSRINPRLIYCSITGFGQNGPRCNMAGHDLNYLALAGLLSLTAGETGAPGLPPAPIAEIGGGSQRVARVIAAGADWSRQASRYLDDRQCVSARLLGAG